MRIFREPDRPHADADLLDELVDDREVTEVGQDRLGHKGLVEQLASLVVAVDTPANIALYGPWGSGKTGIANLLHERLDSREFVENHGENQMVIFDAFKYRELPMRRQFLADLGRGILNKKKRRKLRERLYRTSTDQKLELPKWNDLWKAMIAFWAFVLGVAFSAALVAGGLALLFTSQGFWSVVRATSSALLIPASLLAGFLALAGRTLTIQRTTEVPESAEQFEREFRKLVKKRKGRRLVVFIDELDRCAPNTVVDTLDTIRTFLDVKHTVFIVAADQQVLERALTKDVEQATPTDLVNPYYSSGSAYLDKIFHYQISIPPLLANRVTAFVVDLLAGKGGLWEDLDDLGTVVSVLVPTHVRSPRRVKMLINNYVLTYRSLAANALNDLMSSDLNGRDSEIAKLVCLQTEFPLFARDLTTANRLPQLVVLFLEHEGEGEPERPDTVPTSDWARARGYSRIGSAEVDVMLDSVPLGVHHPIVDSATVEQAVAAERAAPVRAEAAEAHTRQLHDYLLKTKSIEGPSRDLIFRESRGTTFGIDDSVAQMLEEAAVNGRVNEIRQHVADSTADELPADRVLRFLIHLVREAPPGLDGKNATSSMLAAASAATDEVLVAVADPAVQAMLSHRTRSNLQGDDLPGALSLALRSNHPRAGELIDAILDHSQATDDPGLGKKILEGAIRLPDEVSQDRLARVVAARLLDPDTAEFTIEALRPVPHLLGNSRKRIQSELVEANGDGSDEDERRAIATALETADVLGFDDVVEMLLGLTFKLSRDKQWEDLSTKHLDKLGFARTVPLANAILSAAIQRTETELSAWLQAIPDVLAVGADEQRLVDALIAELWSCRSELGQSYETHDADVIAGLRECRRLSTRQVADTDELTATALAETSQMNPQSVVAIEPGWDQLRRFADEGLIDSVVVADEIADRLTKLVGGPLNPGIQRIVEEWSVWVVELATPSGVLEAYGAALVDATAIASPNREYLALLVASAGTDQHCPFTAAEMEGLVENHGTDATSAVAVWLESFADDPSEFVRVMAPYLDDSGYNEVLGQATRVFAEVLHTDQLLVLFGEELDAAEHREPHTSFLRDIRAQELDGRKVSDAVVAAYGRFGSNPVRRERLFAIWNAILPLSTPTQRALIDAVFLPTLSTNRAAGIELAKRYPSVWREPENRKRAVRDALRDAAGGAGRDKKLEKLMIENSVVVSRKGFLWLRGQEVDDPDR